MLTQGYPMTSSLFPTCGDDERFWYWRGASHRRYIHSIYPVHACPPLPGAVYIAVKRTGILRKALAVGRFPVCWEEASRNHIWREMAIQGASEIHVHLLARNEEAAKSICADLEEALLDGIAPAKPGPEAPALTYRIAA